MKRLFIIGNGFDLYHGLKTRFNDFRDYLKNNDLNSYEFIMSLFEEVCFFKSFEDWCHIEDYLVYTNDIDYESKLEEAISSSKDDIDRASYWHDIQYNAGVYTQQFHDFLKSFDEWIEAINLQPNKKIESFFNDNDKFLTFNYTETLQRIYNIPEKNVLHIHGKLGTEKVFGHNEAISPPFKKKNITQEDYENGEDYDWRIEEAEQILNKIPSLFCKNSQLIIDRHKSFFDDIKYYDEIFFLGWALGKQDEVYMDNIISNISQKTKIFIISYTEDGHETYKKHLNNIKNKNIIYDTWKFFSKKVG